MITKYRVAAEIISELEEKGYRGDLYQLQHLILENANSKVELLNPYDIAIDFVYKNVGTADTSFIILAISSEKYQIKNILIEDISTEETGNIQNLYTILRKLFT